MKPDPTSTHEVAGRSPAQAQAVDAPLTRAAIFLVATLNPGSENRATVRSLCGELSALVRAVEFRDLEGGLSCVIGFGSGVWDHLFRQPRPAELHVFREIRSGARHAVSTPGDFLFHIRAKHMDLCFELATQIMARLGNAVSPVDPPHRCARVRSASDLSKETYHMNNLHRELAPISDSAWAQIEEETSRTLKRYLAGRRVVDLKGPAGTALSAIGTGHLRTIAAPAKGIVASQREVKSLVEHGLERSRIHWGARIFGGSVDTCFVKQLQSLEAYIRNRCDHRVWIARRERRADLSTHSLAPNRKAAAWGWRSVVRLLSHTEDACGQLPTLRKERHFISHCRPQGKSSNVIHRPWRSIATIQIEAAGDRCRLQTRLDSQTDLLPVFPTSWWIDYILLLLVSTRLSGYGS